MAWTQYDRDKYRFSAERYSFRGANGFVPSEYVPQLPGMYAFPSGDATGPIPLSSSSSDSSDD